MTKLITVMPVYNGEPYIGRAMESIQRQTVRPDRIVVLDNGSTDTSLETLSKFDFCPIEIIRNPENLGIWRNWNKALTYTREAEYFHMMHADDLLQPDFYEKILGALSQVQGLSLGCSRVQLINEQDQNIGGITSPTRQLGLIPSSEFIEARAWLIPIYCPSIVLKTNGTEAPSQFRPDFPHLADQVFWADWASRCTEVVVLEDVLCLNRMHGTSETGRNKRGLQAFVLDEWRLMNTASDLLKKGAVSRWFLKQVQKCIFAARSQVKMSQTNDPAWASEIEHGTREITGGLSWWLASWAVALKQRSAKK